MAGIEAPAAAGLEPMVLGGTGGAAFGLSGSRSAGGTEAGVLRGADGGIEAVQLSAPIDQHWLYIGDAPHLYPLARVASKYPRYAAVVADSNTARIFVFATGELVNERLIQGMKTRKTQQGGWSQARFQRHIDNYREQHAREVVDALGRIAIADSIDSIVIAGDAVIVPGKSR